MSAPGFLDRLREAVAVVWRRAPASLIQQAESQPEDTPVEPPPRGTRVRKVSPGDVRGGFASAAEGGRVSVALPGVDVSVAVVPVSGGALQRIVGRAWRNPPGPDPIQVALVQGDHVMGAVRISDGGQFQFEDLITGVWSLEFHLERERVVVFQGPPLA